MRLSRLRSFAKSNDPLPTTPTLSLTSRRYLLAEALTLSLRDALTCCLFLRDSLSLVNTATLPIMRYVVQLKPSESIVRNVFIDENDALSKCAELSIQWPSATFVVVDNAGLDSLPSVCC